MHSRERGPTSGITKFALPAAILFTALALTQQDCRRSVESTVGPVSAGTTAPTEKPNFAEYTPPPEGRLIKQKLHSRDGKTVFFLHDIHVDPEESTGEQQENLQVQKQLYAIVRDLVERYGRVGLVLEGWPHGATLQGLTAYFQSTPQSPDEDPQMLGMRKLLTEPNLQKRRQMAETMVGVTAMGAGLILMAAYPDQITTYGSDFDPVRETLQPAQDLDNMVFAVDHPEQIPCPHTQQFTVAGAIQRFPDLRKSTAVRDCYCEFRAYVENTVRDFEQSRFIDAPGREIRVALDAAEPVIAVIAGMNHAQEAMRLLDTNRINGICVAPAVIAEEARDFLAHPHSPGIVIPPDDAYGTCATWTAERQAAYDQAVQAQLQTFLREE